MAKKFKHSGDVAWCGCPCHYLKNPIVSCKKGCWTLIAKEAFTVEEKKETNWQISEVVRSYGGGETQVFKKRRKHLGYNIYKDGLLFACLRVGTPEVINTNEPTEDNQLLVVNKNKTRYIFGTKSE